MSKTNPNRRELLGGASALTIASVSATALTMSPVQAAQSGSVAAPETTDIDLTGTSILITGSSSGFGRLSALHFARQGATVIASMRNYQDGARPEAEELADLAAEEKLKLHVIEIDVLDNGTVLSGVAQAEQIADGALDVVLNNAGIGIGGPIEVHDEAAADLMFSTNTLGYHRVTRAALPAMRERGQGLVLAVSSQLGRLIIPNIGVYCATKFAVEAMFEGMAYELVPFGIDVCIIQPGGYPTKIWENGTRYMDALLARSDEARQTAYADHLRMSAGMSASEMTTDPMDVPRAIATVIAMPQGQRPLRVPVHPNTEASSAANAAMREIQSAVLGGGGYAAWHAAVTD